RHTRCYRDWSSDVCSSDLLADAPCATKSNPGKTIPSAMRPRLRATCDSSPDSDIHSLRSVWPVALLLYAPPDPRPVPWPRPVSRSEERRVGKECRFTESHD